MKRDQSDKRAWTKGLVWASLVCLTGVGAAVAYDPPVLPLQTTRVDFFSGGTPAGSLSEPLIGPNNCSNCHGAYVEEQAPYDRWVTSLMGQASRDPVFWAAFSIAQQDAEFIGDFCLRCHTPIGWARGKLMDPNPTDGSTLSGIDFTGVSCSVCHRMVDPEYTPGVSPARDESILLAIPGSGHMWPHNANFVLDPQDYRRGPHDLQADWLIHNPPDPETGYPGGWLGFHEWEHSPFHSDSRMCATCHDVSTPTYTLDTNTGAYVPNALNAPPPVNKYHQFPEQRTYSEWANSLFGQGPVDLGGRFGGSRGNGVSSCQDCHMPGIPGAGCGIEAPHRPAVAQHDFSGANSWVLQAIIELWDFDASDTALSQEAVTDALERNRSMMERASDMELSRIGDDVNVRVINFSGHKLPTGYVEGRRMWINVRFLAANGTVLAEHGAYDFETAALDTETTKVYEAKHGIDATVAALTGEPVGEAFRLALVNTIEKDNRIPPMGFNNAAFELLQAGSEPPNLYADGQYWDDTLFAIPTGAVRAEVVVYHQTSTREYMEFLRDQDQRTFPLHPETNERILPIATLPYIPERFDDPPANTMGQLAYNLWAALGKSEPVVMDEGSIVVGCLCDWNGNGIADVPDIFAFLSDWFAATPAANTFGGTPGVPAIFAFLTCWFAGCP
ncbi:MAG: hypothetical protein KF869_08205 [Phycisphaeraceae bacterium]|nr:hypothetical protein [Phycisphaeraceae bacterium]